MVSGVVRLAPLTTPLNPVPPALLEGEEEGEEEEDDDDFAAHFEY